MATPRILTPAHVMDQHVPKSPSADEQPACLLSPEAMDDKLNHLVELYGSRWALIRCHMVREFRCAFPAKYLERRWQQMQERGRTSKTDAIRSPLAAIAADQVENQGAQTVVA